MGAADHRAVPGRAPGRCAGDVPAGQEPAGRRARSRPRTAAAAARAADPDPGPALGRSASRGRVRRRTRRSGTCRRCLPSLSVATTRWLRCRRPARRPSGSSRSWGRAESGRRRSRSRSAGGSARPTARTGGVWLARLETASTADDVVDVLIAALNVPGGEAALFERLKGTARAGDPRQLRARRRRRRGSRGSPPRRRPRAADPVHQPGPAGRRRRGRVRPRTSCAARRRRAVHPSGHGATPGHGSSADATPCSTCAAHSTVCRWRSSWPRHEPRRCRSRRSPGASTTASPC